MKTDQQVSLNRNFCKTKNTKINFKKKNVHFPHSEIPIKILARFSCRYR